MFLHMPPTDEMQWYGCDNDVLGEQPPPSVGHQLALVGKTLLYSVGGDADLYVIDISTASLPLPTQPTFPSQGAPEVLTCACVPFSLAQRRSCRWLSPNPVPPPCRSARAREPRARAPAPALRHPPSPPRLPPNPNRYLSCLAWLSVSPSHVGQVRRICVRSLTRRNVGPGRQARHRAGACRHSCSRTHAGGSSGRVRTGSG